MALPTKSASEIVPTGIPDFLFISHANPEDNEFARWLALQLAKEGYAVWCDLTKLLGGEDFWKDIEKAIRERTAKVIFVLSRVSNAKTGPLQELHVAATVGKTRADFILPLRIDDLPSSDISIELGRLNAISFREGWAKGLAQLLEKLEAEKIPKNEKFSASTVASWWRTQFNASLGVVEEREDYLSNWFPLSSVPDTLFCHVITRRTPGEFQLPKQWTFPVIEHGLQQVLTFTTGDDLVSDLGAHLYVSGSTPLPVNNVLAGTAEFFKDRNAGRDALYRLLSIAWEKSVRLKGLRLHLMANNLACHYFPRGLVVEDDVSFVGVDGKRTRRQMVGFKTVGERSDGEPVLRYWHVGIDARPLVHPAYALAIRAHVLFSDDGATIWPSASRLHRARRSQCKDWWNRKWRDLILAAMAWLSEDEAIGLRLGSNLIARVSSHPITMSSPVSYTPQSGATPGEEEPDGHGEDDDDLDENEVT